MALSDKNPSTNRPFNPVPLNPASQPTSFDPNQQQQLQSTINQVNQQDAIASQYALTPIPYHEHNDLDSPKIDYDDLKNRVVTISHVLFGTNAATAGNYSIFFLVPFSCIFKSFSEVHTTAGSDAGSVTLNVAKLTGTTAPGSGTNLLSSTINLKGTANTVQYGTLITNYNTLALSKGDRLQLVLTGTPTALANVLITAQVSY